MEFRHAEPDLLEAARFALYAERLTPVLADMERVRAQPFYSDMSPEAKGSLGMAKLSAGKAIVLFRELLHLEPEDG